MLNSMYLAGGGEWRAKIGLNLICFLTQLDCFVTVVGDLRDTLSHAGYQEFLEVGHELATGDHKRSSLPWGDCRSFSTGCAQDVPDVSGPSQPTTTTVHWRS